jgi:hypothetical protein
MLLRASWQAQLIVTNSALQAATNARIDAETVFGQQGGFSVKSIALGASRTVTPAGCVGV